MNQGTLTPDERVQAPHTNGARNGVSLTGPELRQLLEDVLAVPTDQPPKDLSRFDRFLAETVLTRALALWLEPPEWLRGQELIQFIRSRLVRDIAQLNDLLNLQVNAVLHHPSFQKLEASWRGLHYLVHQVDDNGTIQIRVLHVTWRDLARDFEKALEFDQSQLFRKIYNEEFGMPGGKPYGVLLGDYEIHPRPSAQHPMDDLAVLAKVAGVAAAAFAPFLAAAHPTMFDLDSFTELERLKEPGKIFDTPEYVKWRALRDTDDARFIGLLLPRVLMRLPYGEDSHRVDRFLFREDVTDPERGGYLWGSPVYAFGAVLARAFGESGWLADIRGVQRDVEGGGLVTGLPLHGFSTDYPRLMPRAATEAVITDAQEKELSELGFIPLCYCHHTPYCAFYSNQSVQKPKTYDEMPATINARLSAMLQYMLCVSRFAHYLKVIARDKIGSFTTPGECEDFLRKWLHDYTISNDNAAIDMKARYPLREAKVQIRERPDKPGTYFCTIQLRPHFQLDQMTTAVKLVTELAPKQNV
jgi:type VI secretion system ImpC/EvpB family protein